jgi:hypothetical protein
VHSTPQPSQSPLGIEANYSKPASRAETGRPVIAMNWLLCLRALPSNLEFEF